MHTFNHFLVESRTSNQILSGFKEFIKNNTDTDEIEIPSLINKSVYDYIKSVLDDYDVNEITEEDVTNEIQTNIKSNKPSYFFHDSDLSKSSINYISYIDVENKKNIPDIPSSFSGYTYFSIDDSSVLDFTTIVISKKLVSDLNYRKDVEHVLIPNIIYSFNKLYDGLITITDNYYSISIHILNRIDNVVDELNFYGKLNLSLTVVGLMRLAITISGKKSGNDVAIEQINNLPKMKISYLNLDDINALELFNKNVFCEYEIHILNTHLNLIKNINCSQLSIYNSTIVRIDKSCKVKTLLLFNTTIDEKLPDNLKLDDINLRDCHLPHGLPDGLQINYSEINLLSNNIASIGARTKVKSGTLICNDLITEIPSDLEVDGLYLSGLDAGRVTLDSSKNYFVKSTKIKEVPSTIKVNTIYVSEKDLVNGVVKIPNNLKHTLRY